MEAVLVVAVAVGAVIQGSIGFGYAFVAVPAMALLYPEAVPVTPLLLALLMTMLMSAREWRSLDTPPFFLITPAPAPRTAPRGAPPFFFPAKNPSLFLGPPLLFPGF